MQPETKENLLRTKYIEIPDSDWQPPTSSCCGSRPACDDDTGLGGLGNKLKQSSCERVKIPLITGIRGHFVTTKQRRIALKWYYITQGWDSYSFDGLHPPTVDNLVLQFQGSKNSRSNIKGLNERLEYQTVSGTINPPQLEATSGSFVSPLSEYYRPLH